MRYNDQLATPTPYTDGPRPGETPENARKILADRAAYAASQPLWAALAGTRGKAREEARAAFHAAYRTAYRAAYGPAQEATAPAPPEEAAPAPKKAPRRKTRASA